MMKSSGISVIIIMAIAGFSLYGYVANIVKFCHCDFEQPLQSEVIRGIGIIVGPMGVVTGYMDIEDK